MECLQWALALLQGARGPSWLLPAAASAAEPTAAAATAAAPPGEESPLERFLGALMQQQQQQQQAAAAAEGVTQHRLDEEHLKVIVRQTLNPQSFYSGAASNPKP